MDRLNHLLRSLDRWQQGHGVVAVPYAVIKKYGQDSASTYALLVAWYGFASLFPLLLLAVTIAGIVFDHDPSIRARLTSAIATDIPVVGRQLASKAGARAIADHSVLGLTVGILGLLWGAQGVASAAQEAMATVWNVPMADRPGFVPRTLRNLGILGVLGVNVIATSVLATYTSTVHGQVVLRAALLVLGLLVNLALYVAGFRLLAPKTVPTGDLILGAVLAGVAWSVLQQVGGYLVGHDLAHASATYGVFGLVIGLIAWFSLAVSATLYSAELNVVLTRRLWPRALVNPPLTQADEQALRALALQQRYRKEQVIDVSFEDASEDPVRAELPR
jgi:membrane protein